MITAEFLNGSRAPGCLIILQGPPMSPDIFRVILKTEAEKRFSTTLSIPSLTDTYSVYGYDLEETQLPSTMPAIVIEDQKASGSGY